MKSLPSKAFPFVLYSFLYIIYTYTRKRASLEKSSQIFTLFSCVRVLVRLTIFAGVYKKDIYRNICSNSPASQAHHAFAVFTHPPKLTEHSEHLLKSSEQSPLNLYIVKPNYYSVVSPKDIYIYRYFLYTINSTTQ